MGGLPNVLTGYQPVDNLDAIKKMERAWNVTALSTKPGLKVTRITSYNVCYTKLLRNLGKDSDSEN